VTFRIRDLKVETVPISALKPNPRNPRTHSKRQLRQIADSIKTFGWTNPILADADSNILAGYGRLEGAKRLGIEHVPVIRIDDMSEAQRRAYILADNRLAENAGWDRKLLALELGELLEMDLGFEVTATGFEMGEIDVLISDLSEDAGDDADTIPEIDPAAPIVTKPGDLWQLGGHRLLCDDARKPDPFEWLMAGASAQMVFTDPPYNVPIAGHVSGLGSVKHAEFSMGSGEMTVASYVTFLMTVLGLMAAHSRNGAIHFICIDWRHLFDLLMAGQRIYTEFKNLCVWAKTNAGMGSLYRSQHELVAVFKYGTARHINNVDLGRHGRHRSNLWTYAGVNTFGAERDEALAIHPTVKPVAMVEDAILDCSRRGGIVLDAFAGSGTTLIAAERAGRRAFGIEIEPRYVDVALRRFRTFTGIEPIHLASGRPLEELERFAGEPSRRGGRKPRRTATRGRNLRRQP
jgi:DNA modification methylase